MSVCTLNNVSGNLHHINGIMGFTDRTKCRGIERYLELKMYDIVEYVKGIVRDM